MHTTTHITSPVRASRVGLVVLAFLMLGIGACKSPEQPTRRTEPNLDPGFPRANNFFHEASYPVLKVALPTVPNAEYVNDDEICSTCHPAYAKAFAQNVHRGDHCEGCHGPASRHVEARGKEPGLIFSFKTAPPAQRSEVCLKCHDENACAPGATWRTSAHAHHGLSCTDCHRGHYDVPPGTPATTEPGQTTAVSPNGLVMPTAFADAPAEAAKTDYSKLPSLRGTSHNLGAVAPGVCYRCHGDMKELQEIAGPHQICGPNGFNCTTCHDPHGNIKEETREELCLKCHTGAPTMAWHSAIHAQNGVRCTDCHNPHPRACVPQVVNIDQYGIKRPKRLAMSVQQPEACYKCHQKIYALNALPSHHPIKEGKMVCSDCHDAHGQETDNLKEATINLVCYKCHAEKQGPFAFEHVPVRENCDICHNPHGTVANNLLKQPAAFLCLRCHPGHYSGSRHPGFNLQIDQRPQSSLSQPMFTNCTECHQQIHGTNRMSERTDPYFTR